MLTKTKKKAIVEYITSWSTKAIMEDVKGIDEEDWDDVEAFLEECQKFLIKKSESN